MKPSTLKQRTTTVACTLVLGVSALMLITGCSKHHNPLEQATPKQAARFLVQASQYAEKQLQVFNAPGGHYYGLCMRGREKPALCQKLYQAMLAFARNTVNFNDLNRDDLTSSTVFAGLQDTYQRVQFNTV